MSSSTGVRQLALQVPEPCAVLHFPFQFGGQYRIGPGWALRLPRRRPRSVGGARGGKAPA